jgi:hypothetical protein
VSGKGLRDDEVDHLLRTALPDDLPAAVERELRQDLRRAWRSAASPPPLRWREWLGRAGRIALPQPALAATAVVMLAAGAVMQAAPAPARVIAELESRQAATRRAAALSRARAMRCTVEVELSPGRTRRYRVEWEARRPTRVRHDGEDVSVAWSRGAALAGTSLVAPGAAAAPLDPDVEAVRAYLTPAALAALLDAKGMAIGFDPATHLPLHLEGTGRDGRKQAADCRWP